MTTDQTSTKGTFSGNYLEALRGYAALLVLIHHLIQKEYYLDPYFYPSALKSFEPSGHLSLLVFFLLSGYVIGISNKKRLTGREIGTYLKKRFLRIYPIYFISIALALPIALHYYSASDIVHNFLLTQVAFSPVIEQNFASWSLHYEAVFYILFIGVSFFKVDSLLVCLVSVLIGLVNLLLLDRTGTVLVSSYAFGFTFWSCGLMIAQYFKKRLGEVNFSYLISNFLLFLSLDTFNPFSLAVGKLARIFHFPIEVNTAFSWYQQAISFMDFSFLPFGLLIILTFAAREFKYKSLLALVLQLVPLLTIVHIVQHWPVLDHTKIFVNLFYYLLSWCFFFFRKKEGAGCSYFISLGSWLGAISYGMYIIHVPVLYFFRTAHFFSGSAATFSCRAVLYLALVLSMSYILERKLQPFIKTKLK